MQFLSARKPTGFGSAFAGLVLFAGGQAQAFTAADTHTPMTIASENSRWIALRGRIVPSSPAVVRAALDRTKGDHRLVLVDSPGGSLEPALTIGRLVRAHGLRVAVGRVENNQATDDAQCASACVLLLAAGTGRSVGPDAAVGIHRFVDWSTYSRTWDVYRIFRRQVGGRTVITGRELLSRHVLSSREIFTEVPLSGYAAIRDYFEEMGVSADIVRLMRATTAARLHWMTSAELAATRVATDRNPF